MISALAQALDLARAPRLAAHMRRRPLPLDVLTLIEIASGHPETTAACAVATAHSADFLVAAAELYLRQVVCHSGADPHRMLGAAPGASRERLRRQMRALALWLHPDRNPRGWDAILLQRVLEAWRVVGGAEGAAPEPPRGASSGGPRGGRRRSAGYRPTWISQPVPKRRRRMRIRRYPPMALRVALVVAGLVIPEHAFLGDTGLAEGGTGLSVFARGRDAARPVALRGPDLR